MSSFVTTSGTVDFGNTQIGVGAYAVVDVIVQLDAQRPRVRLTPGGARANEVPAADIHYEVWQPNVDYSNLAQRAAGPTQGSEWDAAAVAAGVNGQAVVRFWVRWKPVSVGSPSAGDLVFDIDDATGNIFEVVTFEAAGTASSAVPRDPQLSLCLVLDRSGSMSDPAAVGDKMTTLKSALDLVFPLIAASDRVGMVSFDHVVDPPIAPTTAHATPASAVSNLTPRGATAIGEGVFAAQQILLAEPGPNTKAILLATDGLENTGVRRISLPAGDPNRVTPLAGQRVFALGIGNGTNVNEALLTSFAQTSGGYFAVTGDLADASLRFRLHKFLLQMVADASQQVTLLDPDLLLFRRVVSKTRFVVSDLETRFSVVVGAHAPGQLAVALLTPDGDWIDSASGDPAVRFVAVREGVVVHVDLLSFGGKTPAGTWTVLATLGETVVPIAKKGGKALEGEDEKVEKVWHLQPKSEGVPAFVVVHGESPLRFDVAAHARGQRPGDEILLTANTTTAGGPILATVIAEVRAPDGGAFTVTLAPTHAGRYRAVFQADVVGTYAIRFRAMGTTLSGKAFHREATRTVTLGAIEPGASIPTSEAPYVTGSETPGGGSPGGGKPGSGSSQHPHGCHLHDHGHHHHHHECHHHHGCHHRHGCHHHHGCHHRHGCQHRGGHGDHGHGCCD